jgi:hypothetical protein
MILCISKNCERANELRVLYKSQSYVRSALIHRAPAIFLGDVWPKHNMFPARQIDLGLLFERVHAQ